ncbi:MAG: hypothetical protein AAF242_16745 [Bacteroidota bacterium]
MRFLFVFLIISSFSNLATAQEVLREQNNFPLSFSIQFQSFGLPFKNLRHSFKNVGIGLGTEFKWGEDGATVQQFKLVRYFNQTMGNGWVASTHFAWRPIPEDTFQPEINLGLAWHYVARPSTAFKLEKGSWLQEGRKGKGMLSVPIGLGFGYLEEGKEWNPYLNYQMLLSSGYSETIPVVPYHFMELGLRKFSLED